jgi:REP element-mobilizing transposase RayT
MPVVILVHLSWTTYRRMPMIGHTEARFLQRFLPAEAQRHGAQVLAMGIVGDHVHLILRLPSSYDVPRMVQGLKGASARLVNRDPRSRVGLRWASGYHATSLSPRRLARAIAYVRGQAERHPELAITGSPAEAGARRPPGDPS